MENIEFPRFHEVKKNNIIHVALLSTLRYVQEDKPSNYALAQYVVTTSLLIPQECKGGYLKGVAGFFRDETGDDWKEWIAFRNKLMNQTLKAQTIVQAVATLLEDWEIQDANEKQLRLFAEARPHEPVNMSTGELAE